MISKLIVIGLAELYLSFLECGKIIGIQKMDIGLQRMGLYSQFKLTLFKNLWGLCLVLGAWCSGI